MGGTPQRAGPAGASAPPGPAATVRRRIVTRDGVALAVTVAGDAAAPVTVVLLHGWTLDARSWRNQVAALAGRRIRTVSYDLRGHGASSPPPPGAATLRHLADDLHEVLDAVAPHGPVVLVGHSMGGMTIMEYAAWYPDQFGARIAGAVLIATAAGELTGPLPPRLHRTERMAYRLIARVGAHRPHRLLTPVFWLGLRWLIFGRPVGFGAVRLATAMITGVPLGTIGGFHPALTAHDRLAALAALDSVPVTVLAGGRDVLTPPDRAERIVAALPHARHLLYRRAGHMLPLERPAEVSGAIAAVARAAARTVPAA